MAAQGRFPRFFAGGTEKRSLFTATLSPWKDCRDSA
jgi:hypothetical protein